MYSLPAGHVEADESALQAAYREAQEEVAVKLPEGSLALVHTMYRATKSDANSGTERVDMFFETRSWPHEPTNNEPQKCDELLWCKLDALPDNVIGEVRQALECITAGRPYSDYGF